MRSQDHRIREKKTNGHAPIDLKNQRIEIPRSQSDNLNHISGSIEVPSLQKSHINGNNDVGDSNQIIRQRVLHSEISNNNVEEDEPVDESL